jgi:hypothetical protein
MRARSWKAHDRAAPVWSRAPRDVARRRASAAHPIRAP